MSHNTILITGGTSGIGRALAEQLLRRTNTVLITGRTEARLAEARVALPGVKTYVCDQSDPAAIERLCVEVIRDFGVIYYLVRPGVTEVVEGGPGEYPLEVVLEFSSMEAAKGWYNSDAYQAILPHRLASSKGNFLWVEGA